MKKHIVRTGLCLLVMILIMLSATVCAFAAERGVDIEVDSVVLDKGLESAEDGYYTVKVPIRIARNAGFVTLRFYAYHPEGIELSGWTDGGICSLSNNTPPIANNGTKNGIAVYYDGGTTVTNETDTGVLITLEYKVPENIALGDIAITLKLVDAYEEDGDRVTLPSNVKSSCTMTNGKISVIETIPELDCGDVNADGNINTLDVIALARHLGDWEGYAEIDSAASDVNADGAVTAIDLICLSRHIANWTGYETFPLANNE